MRFGECEDWCELERILGNKAIFAQNNEEWSLSFKCVAVGIAMHMGSSQIYRTCVQMVWQQHFLKQTIDNSIIL